MRVSAEDRENLVDLSGGAAAACDCYVHRKPYGSRICRHVRSVDAHPRL